MWFHVINVKGIRTSPFGNNHGNNCFRHRSSLHGKTRGEKYSEPADIYIVSKTFLIKLLTGYKGWMSNQSGNAWHITLI